MGLFIPHLGIGGAELQVALLAKGLIRFGRYDPTLFTIESVHGLEEQLRNSGVTVVRIPRHLPGGLDVVWRLASELEQRRISVLHAYLWAANWRAALVHWLVPWIPAIASVRSLENSLGPVHFAMYRLLAPFLARVTGNAEAVVALNRARTGLPPARYRVFRNAVDPARMPEEPTPSPTEPCVGFIARLEPRKDIPLLVAVARQVIGAHPKARFLVVGDGEERPVLEELVRQAGLRDRFDVLGRQQDIIPFLRRMSVLLNTSSAEGCNNAILEAMGAGVPVVATRVGGTPEIVTHGEVGLLAEHGDEVRLSQAVSMILENPGLRERMGRAARQQILREHSLENLVRNVEVMYDEVLTGDL